MAHPNPSKKFRALILFLIKKSFNIQKTFTLQVQTSWNRADAALFIQSFPKLTRTWSETPQFDKSHN
jgi:hypothetical protein